MDIYHGALRIIELVYVSYESTYHRILYITRHASQGFEYQRANELIKGTLAS